MKASHYFKNNICVVSVEGDISFKKIEEVEKYIIPLLDNENIKVMILNCEKVDRIDSTGFNLIITIYNALKKQQASFSFCCLNSENRELFEWQKLDKFIDSYSTEEEALAAFKDS